MHIYMRHGATAPCSADEVTAMKMQRLSVAAILAMFRDEWREAREAAINAHLHAIIAKADRVERATSDSFRPG